MMIQKPEQSQRKMLRKNAKKFDDKAIIPARKKRNDEICRNYFDCWVQGIPINSIVKRNKRRFCWKQMILNIESNHHSFHIIILFAIQKHSACFTPNSQHKCR